MAAGAKPALDPAIDNKADASAAAVLEAKSLTLKDRIIRKLLQVFEHNESLGSTRQ